uniref:DHC_N1 domain-containing protein n=1 Tax=Angiostrongylus cantonensis TaxID=6313 RepID=A0A0K0D1D0_ANGCA
MFKRHLAFAELSWYNDRSRRFAQVVAILNSNYFDDQKVFTLKFTDAFSTVFLSFWDAIAFDPTLSALSISNVAFYKISFRKELESVSNGLPGWSTVVALPPPDTLDPVIFEEERARYQLDIFNAVDQPLQVLARWRGAIARQPADCDSLSVHPVIAALWQTREELQKTLSKTREKPMAYRQKAGLYFSMCSEMRSFCEMTEAIVPTIRILDTDDLWRNYDSSRLQIILAQLRSFTVSANSFRKAITSKFGSFVDVSVTFLQGVDVFLCAVHEVCDIIETSERRAALHVSSNFPVEFQLEPSLDGIENTELLTWCCCDASPMPLRLKVAIIRRRIASSVNPQFDLEWVRHQWQRWYERNIAKSVEKDYVYLARTEEEKDELDVEEFFSEREQEREILPESELASLLVGKREISNNDVDFNYSLALLWLRRILYGVRCFQDELCSFTLDSDLSLMHQIITKVHHDPGGVIDVYRTASLAQFLRASKILSALRERTREIREKWPEQVSLKLILEAIDNFLNARLSATHVKMTKLVENVIEQCEEWNNVADKANNLQNELVPLRELMVEWRKMEVRSWRDLLSRVVEDGRLQAQLVAFPLFDAMFKVKGNVFVVVATQVRRMSWNVRS